jgi:hypothetical protein
VAGNRLVNEDWGGARAVPLAFVSPWIASGLFVFAALLWLVPGRRIEHVLVKRARETSTNAGAGIFPVN